MRRFWLGSQPENSQITLKESTFHHVCRVCRLGVGDRCVLVTGNGLHYNVKLIDKKHDSAVAEVINVEQAPKRKKPYIHLALSCPRFPIVEDLIRKLIELNVSDLHLFTSDFSFIKKAGSLPQSRMKRWESIAQSAMAQSLSSYGLHIHPMRDRTSLLQHYQKQPSSKGLFLYEGVGQKTIYQSLSDVPSNSLEQIWIFIGAEGGFSHKEVEEFNTYSLTPTSIGESILKVDTACVISIGLTKYSLKLF